MSRFIHPVAMLAITSFHDHRNVELHQRYDEIQRKRFAWRVERGMERRRQLATVTSIYPMAAVFRRQAE